MQKYIKFTSLLIVKLIFCNTLIFAKTLSQNLCDFLHKHDSLKYHQGDSWCLKDAQDVAYQQLKTIIIESFKPQTSEPLNGNTVEEVMKNAEQLDPIHLEFHHFHHRGAMVHNMTAEQIDAAKSEVERLKYSLYYYPYQSVNSWGVVLLCEILDPSNKQTYWAMGRCFPNQIHLYRIPYKYSKMLYPLIINIFNKYDPTLANILQRLFAVQIQWESSTKDAYIKWKIDTEKEYYEKFDSLTAEFINSAAH